MEAFERCRKQYFGASSEDGDDHGVGAGAADQEGEGTGQQQILEGG